MSSWFITDKELPRKIKCLRTISENCENENLSTKQIAYQLESEFTLMGYDDPSTETLYLLGILRDENGSSYEPSNLDPKIIEAGKLSKNISLCRDILDVNKSWINIKSIIINQIKLHFYEKKYTGLINDIYSSRNN